MAQDRTALIVGASRGLGLGLAQTLAQRGWAVTATQRTPSPGLQALAGQGAGRGAGGEAGQAVTVETVDIDDDAAVAALHDRLGGAARFDLIFVVAGVATQAHTPIHAVPRDVAAQVYLTNAVSPIRFSEAFLDRLAPGGTLALMTSVLGSVALNESGGWESYRASKAALNTYARSFHVRHADKDLGVLLLHPGWVRTEMGGAEADLDVETSVRGMVDVIEAHRGKTGCVYRDYQGKTLPW